MIGIASGDSALAPLLGFLLCIGYLHLFSKRPFKEGDDNTLGIVLNYSLAFMFLGALLIKVNAQPKSDFERNIFDMIMIFLLFAGPDAIIIDTMWPYASKVFGHFKERTVLRIQNARSKSCSPNSKPQVSLFRNLDGTPKTRTRGTGVDSNTSFVQDNCNSTNVEGTQPWKTNPVASLGEDSELNSIRLDTLSSYIEDNVADGDWSTRLVTI